MGTKMGRGSVYGIHTAAQRRRSSLPSILLKSIKEMFDREMLPLRQKHNKKDTGQKCYWDMGHQNNNRTLNERGGYFLSETYNTNLVWWIFGLSFLFRTFEFFPCLCQIPLSTSFRLTLNSNFHVFVFLASLSCQGNEQKTIRSSRSWINKGKSPHTETENSSIIWEE